MKSKKSITLPRSLKKKKTVKKSPKGINTGELSDKQKLCAWFYVNEKECFGNQTKSYQRAYGVKQDSARTLAAKLFANVSFVAYKNNLLSEYFTDIAVDNELAYLVKQNKDTVSKLGAIKEFNKLKNRVVDKMDLTSKGEMITGIEYVKPSSRT